MKFVLAAVLLLLATTPAPADNEARTVRIEPRPFYGATVTIERGVRVFRPLPRHERIIIDPTMGYDLGLRRQGRPIQRIPEPK